jgi:hypothetical protein
VVVGVLAASVSLTMTLFHILRLAAAYDFTARLIQVLRAADERNPEVLGKTAHCCGWD